MPANSFGGNRGIVIRVHALALYEYSRRDAFANVTGIPGGGTTLVLPDEPSDGDWYAWNNADGSCSAAAELTVALSAAAIAAGVTIQGGAPSLVFSAPDASGLCVWFDDVDTWVAFLGSSGGGVTPPAPGTPAYNPAWYALEDVYLDPVAGSDAASGATVLAPVKTMAEVVRRYGSPAPELVTGQNLTIHQLTPQTLGVDDFIFNPLATGGGIYTWIGTVAAIGAPFHPGAVTAKVQTAAGNQLELVGGLPVGAAVGQRVLNIGKGTYAMIITLAAGTATVTQPLTLTPGVFGFAAEDNTWVAGDTYQLGRPPLVNYKNPAPQGGDTNVAVTDGYAVIQDVAFADPSTSAVGEGVTVVSPLGIGTNLLNCVFQGSAILDGTRGFLVSMNCLSLSALGGVVLAGGTWLGGGALGPFTQVGGNVDCDACLLGTYGAIGGGPGGTASVGSVNLGGLSTIAGTTLFNEVLFDTAIVWGAGTLNLEGGGYYHNLSGGSFAATLLMATLHLDSVATGSSFDSAAIGNPFTAGIALTSANIDTGGGAGDPGLQNPRTLSRFGST